MINVAFSSTAYGPLWAPAVSSWLRAVGYASRHFTVEHLGKLGGAGVTDRMYTHSAENALVHDMFDGDYTHLFMTEADMILPHDCLVKLVTLDKPIASGLYFIRGGHGQPCLYAKSLTLPDNPYPHQPVTLFPTDRPFVMDPQGGGCPGLGCVLVAREVFDKVPYPWFDLKEGYYGSDMYFYTKVREAGIPVWVDPTVRCDQIEYKVWGYDDYEKRRAEDHAFAGSGFVIGQAAPRGG